jgi:cell division protein FtsA
VLTGGGSLLLGITESAQEYLDLPVRVGTPVAVSGMADQLAGPAHATTLGLLQWGLRTRTQHNGHVPVGAGMTAAYQRTIRFFKDFF